jgi:hypothetical protein
MPKTMMLVFSSPTTPAQEAEYNRWYTEKHIHDIAKLPGVISAARYRLAKGIELLPGVAGNPQGWLAVYEIEAKNEDEMRKFGDGLKAALADGRADVSPALSMADISASFALPITDLITKANAR